MTFSFLVAIQNTTFGGTQGFTRKPSTPWTDDTGKFAGVVHQERNWTYVLFDGASHLVPQKIPAAAFVFLREFILGNNQTGLVTSSSTPAIGGEVSSLANGYLPGNSVVFGGSISTTTTFTYPAPTISAWNAFVSSVVSVENAAATASGASPCFARSIGLIAILVTLLASYLTTC